MNKLVKVELTWEDGTVEWLEGPSAEIWNGATKSVAINAWIHGHRMPQLDWQTSKEKGVSLEDAILNALSPEALDPSDLVRIVMRAVKTTDSEIRKKIRDLVANGSLVVSVDWKIDLA